MVSAPSTTKEKLDEAFEKYAQEEHDVLSKLVAPFKEIRNELSTIKADKVSVDGNPSEGRLNVAFRLPDGMILSINKKLGLHDNRVVGFNLIHQRRLLISDVTELSLLREYISNVQNNAPNPS